MPPPLPSGLRTDTLVEIVLNAQPDLSRKRAFREKLQSLLNSNLCSDILKSSFWWFYLDNFKPNKYKAWGFNIFWNIDFKISDFYFQFKFLKFNEQA